MNTTLKCTKVDVEKWAREKEGLPPPPPPEPKTELEKQVAAWAKSYNDKKQ